MFERGANFVGLDFGASTFWDKYIEFEGRINSNSANITRLYERIVHLPILHYDRYYPKFREFVLASPLEEITDQATIDTAVKDVQAANLGTPEKSELEIERMVRASIDAHYYNNFSLVGIEVQKRWTFENAIKRSYFHVTELDETELVNWRKYLDFEEAEGDFKRTSFLYERCLVACALYEEFWLRYARWMFAQGKDENTRIIYLKASCIFVPVDQPTVRLHWARFEEKLGSIQVARDIHVAILDQLPEHVETIISLAGLERRHEGDEAAIQCLDNYINTPGARAGGRLTVEQARILTQCSGDVSKARQLYESRSDKYSESQEFWLSYLKFEIEQYAAEDEDSHARIKKVYQLMRANATFSPPIMKELSHTYMDYLLDCGGKKAAEEYMTLDRELNGYGYVSSTIGVPSPSSAPIPPLKSHLTA